MSYHTRGKDLGSCVEVFQPVDANRQVKLLQYVYDKDGYLDWNHLMVYHKGDKKQVYVVGNHYKKLVHSDLSTLPKVDYSTQIPRQSLQKTVQKRPFSLSRFSR